MTPDTAPERSSLLRATDGGVQATTPIDFSAVYERWFDDVFRWIRMMGAPESDREDLAQDVFVIVHRRLPFFDGRNITGWLFKITVRRVRDFRRLLWVRQVVFGGVSLFEELCGSDSSPADAFEDRENRALLESLLGRLNDMERVTVVLFELDGHSGEAIAELQGVPVNTVWGRIHRARKKLKACISEESSGVLVGVGDSRRAAPPWTKQTALDRSDRDAARAASTGLIGARSSE